MGALGQLYNRVQVVDDPLEVLDQGPLALRAPVAQVVGPVDNSAAVHQRLRDVGVAPDVLAVAVGQHDDARGVGVVPHRDADVALAARHVDPVFARHARKPKRQADLCDWPVSQLGSNGQVRPTRRRSMTTHPTGLEHVLVTEREQWPDGPPHELFKELRSRCPVHWTSKITEYPEEEGFWSVTTAEDVHTVSRDWETFSSANGITALRNAIMPVDLIRAMFIGMDPPKHDRLKALFQRGFTPKRIADHEDEIRAIARGVLEGIDDGRETCDLVSDVAQ